MIGQIDTEILDITEKNQNYLKEKEILLRNYKGENHRLGKIETENIQLNFCYKNTEQTSKQLAEKIEELDQEVYQQEKKGLDLNEERGRHKEELDQLNKKS